MHGRSVIYDNKIYIIGGSLPEEINEEKKYFGEIQIYNPCKNTLINYSTK
jgi:hypothetical protein